MKAVVSYKAPRVLGKKEPGHKEQIVMETVMMVEDLDVPLSRIWERIQKASDKGVVPAGNIMLNFVEEDNFTNCQSAF